MSNLLVENGKFVLSRSDDLPFRRTRQRKNRVRFKWDTLDDVGSVNSCLDDNSREKFEIGRIPETREKKRKKRKPLKCNSVEEISKQREKMIEETRSSSLYKSRHTDISSFLIRMEKERKSLESNSCVFCGNLGSITCDCSKVVYCSKKCKHQDFMHKPFCNSLEKQISINEGKLIKKTEEEIVKISIDVDKAEKKTEEKIVKVHSYVDEPKNNTEKENEKVNVGETESKNVKDNEMTKRKTPKKKSTFCTVAKFIATHSVRSALDFSNELVTSSVALNFWVKISTSFLKDITSSFKFWFKKFEFSILFRRFFNIFVTKVSIERFLLLAIGQSQSIICLSLSFTLAGFFSFFFFFVSGIIYDAQETKRKSIFLN